MAADRIDDLSARRRGKKRPGPGGTRKPPTPPRRRLTGKRRRVPRGRLLLGLLLALLLVVSWLIGFYVDWLWYGELGQREVLITRLKWSLLMGISSALVIFAV